MLGSLKKLFFKDTGEDLATSIPEPVSPAPARDRSTLSSHPAQTASASETSQPAVFGAGDGKASDLISLPFQAIFARLPNSLASLVQSQGSGFVSLPLQKILPQLSKGLVKIPFGEIRHAAPPGTFSDNTRLDQVLVELPLSEILMRLPPSLLARRSDQKQISISPEITDVFGPHGEGISLAAAPVATPSRPGATKPGSTGNTAFLKQGDTSISKRTDTAFRTRNIPAPAPNLHSSPTAVVSTAVSEIDSSELSEPLIIPLNLLCDGWPEMVRVEMRDMNLTNNPIAFPMDFLADALRTGKIIFTWGQICSWMQPALNTPSGAQDTQVELPLKVIAPLFMAKHRAPQAPKKAVLADIPDLFTKKPSEESSAEPAQAKPAPQPVVEAPKPPKSVAPAAPIAFVPPTAPVTPKAAPVSTPAVPVSPISVQPKLQMKTENTTPLPKVEKPAEIKPAVTAAKPAESKPMIAVEAKPVEIKPAVVEAKPVVANPRTIGEVFNQPAKQDWPPAEVLKNLVTLPEIAGAFLAMNDGLLIAAELPATIKAETVAAFLPQIFGRMNQYTKELQMGGLSCLTLVVQNASWQIVKSGSIYLVALSKPGENLPSVKLNVLATELGKQLQ